MERDGDGQTRRTAVRADRVGQLPLEDLEAESGAANTLAGLGDGHGFEVAADGIEVRRVDQARYSQGPGQIEELWIVDVDGRTVILDGLYYADRMPSVVDELRAILASATFELP